MFVVVDLRNSCADACARPAGGTEATVAFMISASHAARLAPDTSRVMDGCRLASDLIDLVDYTRSACAPFHVVIQDACKTAEDDISRRLTHVTGLSGSSRRPIVERHVQNPR